MNLLSSLVDAPALDALAAALLHFVWQGAAMALLLAVWFKWGRPSSPARYTAGVVTLAAMLVAPMATFAWIARGQRVQSIEVAPDTRTLAARSDGAPDSTRIEIGPEPLVGASAMPFPRLTPAVQSAVVVVWFAGVVALSIRLVGGWVVARRLATQAVQPASAELRALARQIAGRMALDRAVSVLESSRVRVPVIVGWLKPVVLFPAATLSSLSPAQIEAILAHELAHIRRHDYLVNLMQSAVETLLFYHPAVWWVSRQVRAEREHCCDDVAVAVCDRLVYVSALSDLARMTTAHGAALAATDGSLVRRVRRLLGADPSTDPEHPGSLPVLALIVLGAIALPVVLTSRVAATPPATANPSATTVVGVSAGEPQNQQQASGNFAVVLPEGATPPGTASTLPPPAAVEEQSATTIEQQLSAELEARRRRLAEVEKELSQLTRARRQLEQTQINNEGQSRMAELTVEIEALKRERARRADMVAVGTLSPAALNELEKELAVMELKMKSARAELELRRSDGDLRMREEELRREIELKMYEMQNTEYRKALEDQQIRKMGGRLPTEDPVVLRELERMSRNEMAMAVSSEVTAPTETIRVDDILIIEIQGEPDLPRAYVVHADGTIRLPLVGTLAMQKLTAAQAKEAVQKLLSKYRIESATGVDVQLRRPRR